MNNLKYWREKLNLTQNELAEKSGISLRTIQRIEAGSPLKGFTLHSIAKALEINSENLITKEESDSIERGKLINLSVLLGWVIPFGAIVFPYFLTSKTKDNFNKQIGKKIIELQIVLTFLLSVFLILVPFIQKGFQIKTPLFIFVLIAFLVVQLIIVILNGISLNKTRKLSIQLKTNFL